MPHFRAALATTAALPTTAALACAAALGTTALACGPLTPTPIDPSGLADPTWTEQTAANEAPSPAPPPKIALATPPAEPPAPVAPVVPRAPVSTTNCPFRWVPKDLGMSVIRLPAAYAGRFMVPLFDAVCACTRPGDNVSVVATIRTLPGSIAAVTAQRTEPDIQRDPSVDACLSAVLGKTQFEGFGIPSDVVCVDQPKDPPKTGMGPPFFRFPRTAGCSDEPQSSTIVYPLFIDRRSEK